MIERHRDQLQRKCPGLLSRCQFIDGLSTSWQSADEKACMLLRFGGKWRDEWGYLRPEISSIKHLRMDYMQTSPKTIGRPARRVSNERHVEEVLRFGRNLG